jgi:hypothetical protein
MNLTAAERKLLQTLSSLGAKLTASGGKASKAATARGRRVFRTREESAEMKKAMIAAVRKGRPVAEVASEFGVTPPYIYQLITKAGLKKRRKSK